MKKDNISDQIEKTSTAKFLEAVENVEWAEIGELVDKLDQIPNFWDNIKRLEEIREEWKRSFVRRKIKQIRINGIPLFASVETTNDEGEKIRVYKREDRFDGDDWKMAAEYHGQVTVYNGKMAFHYADGYEEATGRKMILPFKRDCFID